MFICPLLDMRALRALSLNSPEPPNAHSVRVALHLVTRVTECFHIIVASREYAVRSSRNMLLGRIDAYTQK
jgi:hypothetical protein